MAVIAVGNPGYLEQLIPSHLAGASRAGGATRGGQRSRIRCTSELEEVVVVGELAYTLCRDSLFVTPRAGGEATELAGHRVTIYRKQPDGRWLLARDAHTLSPSAS